MLKYAVIFGLALVLIFGIGGCASKKKVNQGFEQADERMDDLETSIEDNQARIGEAEEVLDEHDNRLAQLSDETRAALGRIDDVEELAMGKLLYKVVLNNDAVKFGVDKAELSEEGMVILDEVVSILIGDNKKIFIEIQGHTDSSGSEQYNYDLGMERAKSVRRHLSEEGIPLHRMSMISYGETRPMTDNSAREGRRANRRVVLLVLE